MNQDAIADTLRGLLPAGASAARQAALDEFLASGLPGRHEEAWKYTDLRALQRRLGELAPAPSGKPLASALASSWLYPDEAVDRLVFLDGRHAPELSRLSDEVAGWISTADRHALQVESGAPALTALNRALAGGSLQLRVPPGACGQRPLYLVNVNRGPAASCAALGLDIELGAGARLAITEHHLALGAAPGLSSLLLRGRLAQDAALTLVRVQEEADARHHLYQAEWLIEAGAQLHAVDIELGAELARLDCRLRLCGDGAAAGWYASSVLNGRQQCDQHIAVEHEALNTRSRMQARGVLDGRSRNVFNGRVLVARDAQGTDSEQLLRNLLLSEHAEADCKPELEIYADDVKCAHGATVGQLDEEALFYLRSRGLDLAQARALLTVSFAEAVLEQLEDEDLRARLRTRIEARLARVSL